MADSPENYHKEACRVEEDALNSSKAHFAAAALWGRVHYWIGIPTTVAAAVAGVSALKDFPTLAGTLALAVAALSALFTFLNPNGRANTHLLAGNQYLALRNAARIFKEIELPSVGDSGGLKSQILKLSERRDELNSGSPQIPTWAFRQAKVGIAKGETTYKVDKSGTKR